MTGLLAHRTTFGIASVLAAPSLDDIRDIRGPIPLPEPFVWWPFALALVAVVAAGALVFGIARRGRRPQSPSRRALARLAAARSRLDAGDAHMFAITVSATVREYVEASFGIHAPSRTTEELLRDLLDARSPIAAHRAELGDFLEHCDLAKYARSSLTSDQMNAMLTSAETFVRATSSPASSDANTAPQQAPEAAR